MIPNVRNPGDARHRVRANEDRRARALDRLRGHAHMVEFEELTVKADLVLRPELADHLDRFGQSLPPRPLVHTERPKLRVSVALPDAEEKPASGEDVQRRNVLGDL